MNKELEALNLLSMEIDKIPHYDERVERFIQAISIIKQALTPPTAEEVCEALNDFIYSLDYDGNPKFMYSVGTKSFICTNGWGIYCDIYGKIDVDFIPLPPHIITLLGRFYENIEE
jgi:hypothetical protein